MHSVSQESVFYGSFVNFQLVYYVVDNICLLDKIMKVARRIRRFDVLYVDQQTICYHNAINSVFDS